jgi:hypothetical protein
VAGNGSCKGWEVKLLLLLLLIITFLRRCSISKAQQDERQHDCKGPLSAELMLAM